MTPDRNTVPGWEGSIGPGPAQYHLPHVYARDVHSGAGNCVCGGSLGDARHVQAAPGVPVPGRLRPSAPGEVTGKLALTVTVYDGTLEDAAAAFAKMPTTLDIPGGEVEVLAAEVLAE